MSHTQCHPFKSVSYEANVVALAVRNRRTGVAVYDLDHIRPEDMPLLCTLLTPRRKEQNHNTIVPAPLGIEPTIIKYSRQTLGRYGR